MKARLGLLLGLVALSGAMAQLPGEACDPSTAGAALVDLASPIGELACKAPDTDFVTTMAALTGTLGYVQPSQLKQLPALMEVMFSVEPAALEPFLALKPKQLERLVPLMTKVPGETLAAVFPVLAKQSPETVARMLGFLKGVEPAQMKRLAPMFAKLQEGQLQILQKAITVMPQPAWEALEAMVKGLGPVMDFAVDMHDKGPMATLLPKALQVGLAAPRVAIKQTAYVVTRDAAAAATGAGTTVDAGAFKMHIGRRLQQQQQAKPAAAPAAKPAAAPAADDAAAAGAALAAAAASDAAAAAPAPAVPTMAVPAAAAAGAGAAAAADAAACDPSVKGIELGIALVSDFGKVVCKFGVDALKPVLEQILAALNKLPLERVKQLPQLTAALRRADPKSFALFFKFPSEGLSKLIPALGGLPADAVARNLKLLGDADDRALDGMADFLAATPPATVAQLVGVFATLDEAQARTMAGFMNAMSPGQVTLALKLLDVFGFQLDLIGQAIPSSDARGTTFMVGPIRVHTADQLVPATFEEAAQRVTKALSVGPQRLERAVDIATRPLVSIRN